MDPKVPQIEWNRERSSYGESNGEPREIEPQGFKLTPQDIAYIFFRHKWKIVGFALIGLAAAAFIYISTPKSYRSKSKVMVKFVAERESLGPSEGGEGQAKNPVLRGEWVLNSELELFSSADVARKAAEKVGPARILAAFGGGNDPEAAGKVVNQGTSAYIKGGNVIEVTFQHPDPTIVQPVLQALMQQYEEEHYKTYRGLDNVEKFNQMRDVARHAVETLEDELANWQKTNSVFSPEEAQKIVSAQVTSIENSLLSAQTELAIAKSALAAIEKRSSSGTNVIEKYSDQRQERREEYGRICRQLELKRKLEQDGSVQLKETSKLVDPIRKEIEQLTKQKKAMEAEDPALALSAMPGGGQSFDPFAESLKITMLESKIDTLSNQLETARAEQARVYDISRKIRLIQSKKESQEKNYNYFATTLAAASFDADLGASRNSNIRIVETPTSAERVIVSLFKRMAMAAGGGIGLGLAFALLMELFVDQNVKRATEVSRMLPVPIYLSIPNSKGASPLKRLPAGPGGAPRFLKDREPDSALTAETQSDDRLQPYFEALRDRILNRFLTLTRKPKLVGVCGCSDASGVSSTATGLAAALSEAGDLKVLLVDLKNPQGTGNPLYRTRKACTLLEALEHHKRQEGLIAPNLYLATADGPSNQQVVSTPTKFKKVVPQLNASDYDYIVFDMPVVDQVSITPALAKHMDLTLLVVEAEKEHRNTVKQAGSLLLEFTSNVAVILNNTQADLPKWLQQSV